MPHITSGSHILDSLLPELEKDKNYSMEVISPLDDPNENEPNENGLTIVALDDLSTPIGFLVPSNTTEPEDVLNLNAGSPETVVDTFQQNLFSPETAIDTFQQNLFSSEETLIDEFQQTVTPYPFAYNHQQMSAVSQVLSFQYHQHIEVSHQYTQHIEESHQYHQHIEASHQYTQHIEASHQYPQHIEASFQPTLSQSDVRIVELECALKQSEKKATSFEKQAEKSRLLKRKNTELEKYKHAKDAEIDRLKKQLEKSQSRLQEERKKRKKAARELNTTQKELETSQQKLETSQQKLKTSQKKFEDADKEKMRLINDNLSLKNQLTYVQGVQDEIQELTQALTAAQQEVASYKAKLNDVVTLTRSNKNLVGKFKSLEIELMRVSQQKQKLESDLSVLKQNINELQSRLNDEDKAHQKTTSSLKAAKDAHQALTTEYANKLTLLSNSAINFNQLLDFTSVLQVQLNEARENLLKTESERKELNELYNHVLTNLLATSNAQTVSAVSGQQFPCFQSSASTIPVMPTTSFPTQIVPVTSPSMPRVAPPSSLLPSSAGQGMLNNYLTPTLPNNTPYGMFSQEARGQNRIGTHTVGTNINVTSRPLPSAASINNLLNPNPNTSGNPHAEQREATSTFNIYGNINFGNRG